MAVPQYIRETSKRVQPVTDAEVQQFFEANKERAQGRTLDQLRQPIQEFLAGQRQQQVPSSSTIGKRWRRARHAHPPRLNIEVASTDPVKGRRTRPSPLSSIRTSSVHCARVNPTLDQVRKEYGDKVKIVFKDFPLPNHAEAPKAAEAAHCAGGQGKFWELHDRMFATNRRCNSPPRRNMRRLWDWI